MRRAVRVEVRMNVGEHDDGVADPYLGMADLPSRRLVPEQLDGAERLRVEVERALGAVDDQVGRDAVVPLGNLLRRHRGLLARRESRSVIAPGTPLPSPPTP